MGGLQQDKMIFEIMVDINDESIQIEDIPTVQALGLSLRYQVQIDVTTTTENNDIFDPASELHTASEVSSIGRFRSRSTIGHSTRLSTSGGATRFLLQLPRGDDTGMG